MIDARRKRSPIPAVETLEGRSLLSGAGLGRLADFRSALVGLPDPSAIKTDPGAVAAIMNALGGGIGSEWATLIRRQVRNPQSIIRGFAEGRMSAFSTAGLTARKTAAQSEFTGKLYDQLEPTLAGAAVFKGNVLELAAIFRGEFRNPDAAEYVFALDRGSGVRLGPTFASRPAITPDALVSVTVGPFGSSPTGTIRDLADGTTRVIDPSQIAVRGATLRVFLDANQLPSRGVALARYRFAMWTQTRPGTDIANVASFAPDSAMIPIAVQKGIAVRDLK